MGWIVGGSCSMSITSCSFLFASQLPEFSHHSPFCFGFWVLEFPTCTLHWILGAWRFLDLWVPIEFCFLGSLVFPDFSFWMWSCGFFEFFSTFAPSGRVFLFLFSFVVFQLPWTTSVGSWSCFVVISLFGFRWTSSFFFFWAFCLIFSSLVAFWLDRHPALGFFKACLT